MLRKNRGFTLVEIITVVGIIAIILAIGGPTWFRQREISRASSCQENLAKIDQAIQVFAMDNKLSEGDDIDYPTDLISDGGKGYLKKEPQCESGGTYTIEKVGDVVTCSIGGSNDPFAAHELQN